MSPFITSKGSVPALDLGECGCRAQWFRLLYIGYIDSEPSSILEVPDDVVTKVVSRDMHRLHPGFAELVQRMLHQGATIDGQHGLWHGIRKRPEAIPETAGHDDASYRQIEACAADRVKRPTRKPGASASNNGICRTLRSFIKAINAVSDVPMRATYGSRLGTAGLPLSSVA